MSESEQNDILRRLAELEQWQSAVTEQLALLTMSDQECVRLMRRLPSMLQEALDGQKKRVPRASAN